MLTRKYFNNTGVLWSSVKCPIFLSDFNKIRIFFADFDASNIKSHENPFSGSPVDTRKQTQRQTGRRDEANKRFRDFAKAPSKEPVCPLSKTPLERWRNHSGKQIPVTYVNTVANVTTRTFKLDWSVCTCLTQLYDGRYMYRIYYIKNNYMFRHFTLAIFRLRNEKT